MKTTTQKPANHYNQFIKTFSMPSLDITTTEIPKDRMEEFVKDLKNIHGIDPNDVKIFSESVMIDFPAYYKTSDIHKAVLEILPNYF